MEQQQLVKTARITGAWYLVLAISGVAGFMIYHPRVYILSDPQKTLGNLVNSGTEARLRLVFELLIIVSQALAAVWFYQLFARINKRAATVLCTWGTVNAMIIMISAISMSSAINIANTASLSYQEKIPLIAVLTNIISNTWSIGGLFFGLWLIPMGYIVIRSKRMPVWLGRILVIGGAGYLLQTFMKAIGMQASWSDLLVMPATAAEFWMIGYLLIFGIRPEPANPHQQPD
jgi:hypothetical protein